jgi:heme exporter protein C
MRYWWWKILAVALLLFASIAALRAPLAPALIHVSPDRLPPGEATLTITGYNTGFSNGYRAYLINGEDRLCADRITILSSNRMEAVFSIPLEVSEHLSSLVVHHPEMGRLGIPNAIFHASTGAGIGSGDCDVAVSETLGAGAFNFPNRSILYESIRNLNFHVPMWFTMMVVMGISLVHSIKALGRNDLGHDRAAAAAVHTGLLFCGLGLVTGMVWARATWGAWWTNDVKLNGAAVTALIYLAYLVLRGSVPDPQRRTKLAGVYNIFAFMLLVLFLLVVPRLNQIDSLHPGSGGNPAFNQYDLDDNLRMVFYPAVAGWILLGIWLHQLRVRTMALRERLEDMEYERAAASGRRAGYEITS